MPSPDQPSAHRSRRIWIYLLVIFTFAIGGLVAWSLDEAPPDVSDLKFEPLALADTDNAYILLARVAEQADRLLTLSPDDKKILDTLSDGQAWNDDRVDEWLRALESVWPHYEQAARTPRSQAPIHTSPEATSPEIGHIQRLSQLSLLRARQSLRKNNPEAAIAQALISTEAGKRIAESRGSIISYLTGTAIQHFSLSIITEAARHPGCPVSVMRDTIKRLDETRTSHEALAYAFRSELYFCEGVLKIVESGGPDTPENSYLNNPLLRLGPGIPLIYKGNKTRRIYADQLRDAIRHIGTDSKSLMLYREYVSAYYKRRSYNPDNMVGRMVLNIVTPTASALIKTHHTRLSWLSAHQALIAALVYERENGKAPDTLDQLVPAYLDAVPQDYFTRAPLRYDAALGAIWSAGENNLIVTSPDRESRARDIIVWIHPRPAE